MVRVSSTIPTSRGPRVYGGGSPHTWLCPALSQTIRLPIWASDSWCQAPEPSEGRKVTACCLGKGPPQQDGRVRLVHQEGRAAAPPWPPGLRADVTVPSVPGHASLPGPPLPDGLILDEYSGGISARASH